MTKHLRSRFAKTTPFAREVASLFKLNLADARKADEIFTEVSVKAGTDLAWEGSDTKQLVLILDGEVEVTRDGELVAVLGPGSVLGEITALDIKRTQTASATMRTDGRIAAAGRTDLGKLRDCTGLYLHLQHLASRRLVGA
jgi:CRP-like cAMP-binding protein